MLHINEHQEIREHLGAIQAEFSALWTAMEEIGQRLDALEATQAACNHRRSGTMLDDGRVRCDDCGKLLDVVHT